MTSARAALHPLAIAALALLIVNDHVLKAGYPGWCTGKLSDVAGLACFPIGIAAAGELCGLWPGGRRTLIAIAIATGIGFAAIKLAAPAADLYRVGLAALQWPARALWALLRNLDPPAVERVHLTRDPSDLLALPALALGPWLVARTGSGRTISARWARSSRAARAGQPASVAAQTVLEVR